VIYRYWDWGQTVKRDDYQYQVLELALEKSAAAYGPWRAERVYLEMTPARAIRSVNAGIRVNVRAGPWAESKEIYGQTKPETPVPFPLLKNLLGHRQLIIRREDQAKFETMSPAELAKNVAGQGVDWVDARIYRHNEFRVNASAPTFSLLRMLDNKRFDYLPMSVLEIPAIVAGDAFDTNKFTVVEHLLIYYPHPIVFRTSNQQPILAERLTYGLQAAKADGSFDALFDEYYGEIVRQLQGQHPMLVSLDNPFLPESLDQRNDERVKPLIVSKD